MQSCGRRCPGLPARGELERAYAGLPVSARSLVVFAGVPESTVVGGVKGERRVVAQRCLGALGLLTSVCEPVPVTSTPSPWLSRPRGSVTSLPA